MIVLVPYEMPLVVRGSLDEAATKEALESVKKLIIDSKGEVGEIEEWGKKTLQYLIKKEKTATYFLVNFEADQKAILNFDKKLKLQENLLRFLILKKVAPKKNKPSLRSEELKEKKAKEAKKEN